MTTLLMIMLMMMIYSANGQDQEISDYTNKDLPGCREEKKID